MVICGGETQTVRKQKRKSAAQLAVALLPILAILLARLAIFVKTMMYTLEALHVAHHLEHPTD